MRSVGCSCPSVSHQDTDFQATCTPVAVNFDTHIEQMFSILYSGGLLVISRPGHHTDPDYMMQLMAQHGVTYLFTVRP